LSINILIKIGGEIIKVVGMSYRMKPRKGVYSIWDVAPEIADSLTYNIEELIPEGVKKIECRFFGKTPLFASIIHGKKDSVFVIEGNSEYLSEEDYREMGFDPEKYSEIRDSIACVYAAYVHAMSDISKEDFEKRYKVGRRGLSIIRKYYDDYTADFTIE